MIEAAKRDRIDQIIFIFGADENLQKIGNKTITKMKTKQKPKWGFLIAYLKRRREDFLIKDLSARTILIKAPSGRAEAYKQMFSMAFDGE